ncbi:hypothetical protein E6P97_01990 [Patescibacteria group bacterium]|nr:MAG: hypothetical protein E6P97_01990 [Patescibacteria group bacterium]
MSSMSPENNPPDSRNEQHRADAHKRLSTLGRKFFDMLEYDVDEQLIMDVRKHPFGLFVIEVTGFFITLIVAIVPIVLAYNLGAVGVEEGGGNGFQALFVIFGLVMSLLALAGTFIAGVLYKNNVIYITNEKLAQIRYLSLFNRKVSQLSIGDIQDVSVQQRGIFAHWFNYGTLVVETSGEQQNYTFTYVPKPYQVSRAIVGAHEENLKLYGN